MIDPQEHTVSYKLFHYYFNCKIPAAFANAGRQTLVGTPQYTDKGMADVANSEMITRQHTISEMVEYSRKGARVVLCNPEDSVVIYGLLRDHLRNQQEKVRYNINAKSIPLADLEAMDEFAAAVYRIARNYQQVDEQESLMNRKLDSMFRHRGLRRKSDDQPDKSTLVQNAEPVDAVVPEHRPITSEISRTALDRGFRYK